MPSHNIEDADTSFPDPQPEPGIIPAPKKKRRGRRSQVLVELATIGAKQISGDELGSDSTAMATSTVTTSTTGVPQRQQQISIGQTSTLQVAIPHGKSVLPVPQAGYVSPSPIAGLLLAVVHKVAHSLSHVDPDYEKLSQAYLSTDHVFHVMSQSVRAVQLGLAPGALPRKLWRLMAAQWHWSQVQRFLLEESLAGHFPQSSLLLYLDYNSYDETSHESVTERRFGREFLEFGGGGEC